MSHAISGTDTYVDHVTVPDGTDSGTTRAQDVTNIATTVLNNTVHLATHSAFKDAHNTFTAGQTFDFTDASTAIVFTSKDANDHPGSASNMWKLIQATKCSDGSYVRHYTGDGTNDWIITSNAAWDPASGAQHWVQDSGAQISSCLWARSESVHWFNKAAGASPWGSSSWDSSGDVRVGGTAITRFLHVTGAGTSTTIDGALVASVIKGDEFQYTTPPTQTKAVNILSQIGTTTSSNGLSLFFVPGALCHIPLNLPHGATLGAVRIKHSSGIAHNVEFRLNRRQAADFGSSAAPTFGPTTTTTFSGSLSATWFNSSISWGGIVADKDESYSIEIANSNASANNFEVAAIDITYTDPGPRNH